MKLQDILDFQKDFKSLIEKYANGDISYFTNMMLPILIGKQASETSYGVSPLYDTFVERLDKKVAYELFLKKTLPNIRHIIENVGNLNIIGEDIKIQNFEKVVENKEYDELMCLIIPSLKDKTYEKITYNFNIVKWDFDIKVSIVETEIDTKIYYINKNGEIIFSIEISNVTEGSNQKLQESIKSNELLADDIEFSKLKDFSDINKVSIYLEDLCNLIGKIQ